MNLADIRTDYGQRGLVREDLSEDPLQQFVKWFSEAAASEIVDVNAMSLATVTPDGRPAIRTVLLKGIEEGGFMFFTNYVSPKGVQLEGNPHVALLFYWAELERQVVVRGSATKVSEEQSQAYFSSRPRGSQLGAWASQQSEKIADRDALERAYAEAEARFQGDLVPRPPHWGGYKVDPEAVEFWQGRPSRLHDRFLYTLGQSGVWQIERLNP